MAAKRKRSLRGLGGTPEHHRQMATAYEKAAMEGFKEAKKEATRGNCSLAFVKLESSLVHAGWESAHRNEVEPSRTLTLSKKEDEILDARMKATSAFAKKCMGRPLSGLGRSPRRRRR